MAPDDRINLLLNAISPPARRGWWGVHRETAAGDREVFFYLSFHVHPDGANRIESLLRGVIEQSCEGVKWWLSQSQPGRFFLCPEAILERVRQPPKVTGYTNEELQIAHEAYLAIPALAESLNAAQRSAP